MIFVDAGPLIAKYLSEDPYRRQAEEVWRKLGESKEPCVTSNFVVNEVITFIGRRAGGEFAARKGRVLLSSERLEVLRPDEEDEWAATEWMEKYADQNVSFTDCISFVLMKKAGIQRVFSFDRHFALAGFALVP